MVAAVGLFLAVSLALLFAGAGRIHFQFDPKKKPVSAVEFIQKEHLKGNMFNNVV